MVVLNLFIAVILQAFNEARKSEEIVVNEENIRKLMDHWKIFDIKAIGLLSVNKFELFINSLGPPFGVKQYLKDEMKSKQMNFFRKKGTTKMEFISRLGLPVYIVSEKDSNRYLHLYDVMLVLCKLALFENEREKYQLTNYE